MEAALKAISAPTRRRILTLVRDGELSAGEIAAHFDVTRPAVSQHLNVLKEAGLVNERRNGTKRLYRARSERRRHDPEVPSLRPAGPGARPGAQPRLGSLPRAARGRGGRRRTRRGQRPGGDVKVVGHDEWLAARKELLAKEKAFTRAR